MGRLNQSKTKEMTEEYRQLKFETLMAAVETSSLKLDDFGQETYTFTEEAMKSLFFNLGVGSIFMLQRVKKRGKCNTY